MTATATRTIVETKPGFFMDPDTKRRTKKQDGDQVISKAEFEKRTADAKAAEEKVKPEPKSTVLTSGKVAQGQTVEITCRKRGCSEKRRIKIQDKFQVKFCVPHQKEHRNELRRQRRQAKAKAAKKS